MPLIPSRRAVLGWALAAALPATSLHALDVEEADPSDLVPRRFGIDRFTALSEAEIHKVHLAIRRGRTIVIDGYSPSESRRIIRDAAQDWPATRARLRGTP